MFRLSPMLTFIMLGVMPLVIPLPPDSAGVQEGYRRIRVAVRDQCVLAEHVTGIAVLQLFNRGERSRASLSA
jgi:ATP-binding cassette subfamily B protein